MNTRTTYVHRGLTILELMLALTITVVIGAGLAAVLTMISQVTSFDRDARSSSLRAHAVQLRLQAYSETGLCVLQSRAGGEFAMWLEDSDSSGSVNLSEVRVFFVEENGTLVCERFNAPDGWTPEQIAIFDIAVPRGTDFFTFIVPYREAGVTTRAVIADGLSELALTFDTATPVDSDRFRYTFRQTFSSGNTSDSLIALALTNHTIPEL